MGAHDFAHLADIGNPNGYTMPSPQGRAATLATKLLHLDHIKPALRSRYLVKGWLDRGASSVVFGESNVGKTFFALDLAMHIASGQTWHGHRVALGAGAVVYVAGEGGAGICNRIEALRRERAHLTAGADFVLLPTALDLCTSEDADHLAIALADLNRPISLIVIDTLARAMGNGDENAAKDMGAFVRSVDFLRAETGAHVMVIHHSGKDTSKGARGSGALRGAVDTEIELTRSGQIIQAETRKQRDMPNEGLFAYTLHDVTLGTDEDGDPVTSAVVQPTEAPVKRGPKLTGQALIAMQAFGDALAAHGVTKTGSNFPSNRKCVSLDHWRTFCDGAALSSGESDGAKRKAFWDAKTKLQAKNLICIADGFAWRVFE